MFFEGVRPDMDAVPADLEIADDAPVFPERLNHLSPGAPAVGRRSSAMHGPSDAGQVTSSLIGLAGARKRVSEKPNEDCWMRPFEA